VNKTAERTSVGELQELLAAGLPVTVVDVRSLADLDWAIPGSVHVDAYDDLKAGHLGPLAELKLPRGPVVTVCAMGNTAAQTLLNAKQSLGAMRNHVHRFRGTPVIVTYHPAALLRNPNWKRPTWDDVRIARRLLD